MLIENDIKVNRKKKNNIFKYITSETLLQTLFSN